MAELRPYEPSWRDRLGQLLMGDGRASPERRRFISGLLGSTGLGQTGMSLVDLTPLAAPLSANEAYRDYQDGNYTGAGLNALGTVLGAAPALAGIGKGAKNLLSRSASLYDPPVKPLRPFEADYPAGAPADARGKLTQDLDGRPLTARYVAGRNYVGEGDTGIPASAYDAIGKEGTGRHAQAVAAREIGGDAGRYVVTRDRRSGKVVDRAILVDKNLNPDTYSRVLAHEVGHAVDELAGTVPTAGLSDELRGVYNSLNNGHRNAAGMDARANAKPFLPQHNGYKDDDIPREYMAEAIRAYMADPNYLKTVAPKTAARIREYVNPNPRLNQTIQFNSIVAPAAGIAAGGAVLAGSDDAKAWAMAPELPPGAVLIDEPRA